MEKVEFEIISEGNLNELLGGDGGDSSGQFLPSDGAGTPATPVSSGATNLPPACDNAH